jgi:hypothetical protein
MKLSDWLHALADLKQIKYTSKTSFGNGAV